jgi:hypothetical protein
MPPSGATRSPIDYFTRRVLLLPAENTHTQVVMKQVHRPERTYAGRAYRLAGWTQVLWHNTYVAYYNIDKAITSLNEEEFRAKQRRCILVSDAI